MTPATEKRTSWLSLAVLLLLQFWTIPPTQAAPTQAAVLCDESNAISQQCGVLADEWYIKDGRPKAIVIIVHGFTQEAKSMSTISNVLAVKNYLVLAMDLRGHGRCRENRQKRLVDYHASLADFQKLCHSAREAHPGLPLYCIGESTGSAVIAQAVSQDPSIADGIILASAGPHPRIFNVPWVVEDFFGWFLRFEHPVSVRKYIAKYASNESRVTKEMLEEPGDRVDDLSARELIRTAWFISRTPGAVKLFNNNLPVLVLQGKQDHITRPRDVRAMMSDIKTEQKRYVQFPNYGHVIIGTSFIHTDVMQTITNWLDEQNASTELSVKGTVGVP